VADDERDGQDEPRPRREARIRGFAKRIFRELDPDDDHRAGAERADRAEPGPEPRDRSEAVNLLSSLLETGDKAKTEMVRMLAREVRGYLEALELHKDLHHLLTNYSLEVKASIHLKPLTDAPAPPPSASASLRPRARDDDDGSGG
jgi:hypothetical protein